MTSLSVLRLRSPRCSRAGFTLIEVTIALGICATVMIALLGLLPMSLDQMRESRRLTTIARISEDIINDCQLMDWDDLERLDGERREYDDQGTRIEEVSLENKLRTYSAEIEVIPEGLTMPGAVEPTTYARRVNIYIGITKGQSVNLKSKSLTDDTIEVFSTVLAQLDEVEQ